ncbi:MAG: hypothetical protein A2516_00090 [Alphaproteobacteria bacterium RIFOXYD12_FULL_60_8]|nr:MAG: hypothetical protein A2516_00090 [Alphaproteobacteria bacterium RIFOXYD12_FULL_60_8]
MPPRSEKDVRIEILEQALRLGDGQAANYFREPEISVARELVREGLVSGNAKDVGGVGVTGIRDSGRDYLRAQRPLQKIWRVLRRILVVVCSFIVAVATYILGLDSIKKSISKFLGHFLK